MPGVQTYTGGTQRKLRESELHSRFVVVLLINTISDGFTPPFKRQNINFRNVRYALCALAGRCVMYGEGELVEEIKGWMYCLPVYDISLNHSKS